MLSSYFELLCVCLKYKISFSETAQNLKSTARSSAFLFLFKQTILKSEYLSFTWVKQQLVKLTNKYIFYMFRYCILLIFLVFRCWSLTWVGSKSTHTDTLSWDSVLLELILQGLPTSWEWQYMEPLRKAITNYAFRNVWKDEDREKSGNSTADRSQERLWLQNIS